MRRIKTKQKQKILRRSKKRREYELKRKRRRRKLKYHKYLLKIRNLKVKKFYKNPDKVKHTKCIANEVFSIVDNTEEIISYFQVAKKSLDQKIPVYFDLRFINEIDTGALTYLCALVNDRSFKNGTPLQGNLPSDRNLKEQIMQSGFIKFVYSNIQNYQSNNKYGELIHETKVKVEETIAKNVSLSAMKHTYGITKVKSLDIYKIIIECMANTHNHAANGEQEVYNWWLLAYQDSKTKVTKFCFLDIGVGIFDSLKYKYTNNILTKKLLGLGNLISLNDNKKTLIKIFEGSYKTSTKESKRGRGIKTIYYHAKKNNKIKRFTMISNNIKASIGYNTADEIKILKNDFQGTLYYWELTP